MTQRNRFADCEAMLAYARDHATQLVTASPTGAPFPEPSPCAANPACDIFPAHPEFAFPQPGWTPMDESASEHGGLLKVHEGVAYFRLFGQLFSQPLDGDASDLAAAEVDGYGALFVSGDRALLVDLGAESTTLVEVDIADPHRMEVVRTRRIAARGVGMAQVGNHLRLVLQGRPAMAWKIAGSGGAVGSVPSEDPEELDAAREHNRALIDEADAASWLLTYEEVARGNSETLPLLDCSAMTRPQREAGMSIAVFLDVDIAEGLEHWTAHGLFAEAVAVYGSGRELWVATRPWQRLAELWSLPDGEDMFDPASDLHLFGAPAAGFPWLGVAAVPGSVIDVVELTPPTGAYVLSGTVVGDDGRRDATLGFVARMDGSLRLEATTGSFSVQSPSAIARSGDKLLIASSRNEVRTRVIDVSEPAVPVEQGLIDLFGPWIKLTPLPDGRAVAVGRAVDAQWNYAQAESYLKIMVGDEVLQSFDLGLFQSDIRDPSLFHLEHSTQSLVTCGMSFSGSLVDGIDCIAFDLAEGSPRELGKIEHSYDGLPNRGYRRIRGARIADGDLITVSIEELRVTDLDTMRTRLLVKLP